MKQTQHYCHCSLSGNKDLFLGYMYVRANTETPSEV